MEILPQQPMITAKRHMIVAGHYLATEAGAKILEVGGGIHLLLNIIPKFHPIKLVVTLEIINT